MTANFLAHGAATLLTGLSAGLFVAFAVAVLPGLRTVDDAVFTATMRSINRAILNGWFFTIFLGSPVLTGVAAALGWRAADGGASPLGTILALLCCLVVIGVTGVVHVPLNNRLESARPEEGASGARTAFEAKWVRWHLVRTGVSVAAFGLLLAGLPGAAP